MRGHVAMVLALATLALVGPAGNAAAAEGEAPVTIPIPSVELPVNVGFGPKALSKTVQTPISLTAQGEISEFDGSHPPALRELTMEFEKTVEIHAAGIPCCRRDRLGETTDTVAALRACRSALIGEGEVTVQVAYPEQNPINVRSKILVFKAGERDGKTTLFLHAYLSNPVSAAIVIPVTISRHANGMFGTRAIAKIPQIAGGWGSIAKFDFRISRDVDVEGGRVNPISATCPDGELRVLNFGKFEDGERAETEVVRACTAEA
jgi:hypothetical protein